MLTPWCGIQHRCDDGVRRVKSDGPAAGSASAEADDDYKHIIASIRSTIISVCPEDLKPYLIPPEPNRVANKDRLAEQAAATKAVAHKKRAGEAAGKTSGATSPTLARKRSASTVERGGDASKRPKVAAAAAAPAPAVAPSPQPAALPSPTPVNMATVHMPPAAPDA